MLDTLALFGIFVFADIMDILLGGGGGLIILPLLIAKGFDPFVAVASMNTAFLGTLIGSMWKLKKKEKLVFSQNTYFYVLFGILGAILGVFIGKSLNTDIFEIIIAISLFGILVAWNMPTHRFSFSLSEKWRFVFSLLLFLFSGSYIAIIGSGGGIVLTFLFLFATQKTLKEIFPDRIFAAFGILIVLVFFYFFLRKNRFSFGRPWNFRRTHSRISRHPYFFPYPGKSPQKRIFTPRPDQFGADGVVKNITPLRRGAWGVKISPLLPPLLRKYFLQKSHIPQRSDGCHLRDSNPGQGQRSPVETG
jgi:uncharacterized membrane protein YfcA